MGGYPEGTYFNISATWDKGPDAFHAIRMYQARQLVKAIQRIVGSKLAESVESQLLGTPDSGK